MGMWILIFLASIPPGYKAGPALSVTSLPVFQSQEACQEAGRKLVLERKNGPIENLVADWSCIQAR